MGGGMDGTGRIGPQAGYPMGTRQYMTITLQRRIGDRGRAHITVPTTMSPDEALQTAALLTSEAQRLKGRDAT